MGQYFKYVNLDKKEFLDHSSGGGHKLMEFSWEMNSICTTVKALLASSWKGDKVHLIGDYYDEDEDAFIALKYSIISDPVLSDLSHKFESLYGPNGKFNVYNLISSEFSEVKEIICEYTDAYVAYVAYNHTKHEVCNVSDGVFESISVSLSNDKDNSSVHMWRVDPLNLLLSINADGGGGGYFSKASKDLVGSWALDDIELFKIEEDPKLVGYTPIHADFTENDVEYRIEDLPDFFKTNRFSSIEEFKDYFSTHLDELNSLIQQPYLDVYVDRKRVDNNTLIDLCSVVDSDLDVDSVSL